MGSPEPGRITLRHEGAIVLEAPVEYRLNSIMTIKVQGLAQPLTFDRCELYRPGDAEPFLHREIDPLVVDPDAVLDVAWDVRVSRDGGT